MLISFKAKTIGMLSCLLCATLHLCAESTKPALTVREAIEAAKIVRNINGDSVFLSPDQTKYLVVIQRGDIVRNGTWLELVCGDTRSLNSASSPATIARLFSISTAGLHDLISNIQWIENGKSVAFLWNDGRRPTYVAAVEVRTGRMRTVVQHETPIAKYDISSDGRNVVFIAYRRRDEKKLSEMRRKGFAVTDQSIWALLDGNVDGWERREHYEVLFSAMGARPHRVQIPLERWAVTPEALKVSPDGHFAVLILPAGKPPTHWDKYTEHVFKDIYLPPAREHPDSPNWIRRYFLIDLKRGIARPLWDAPSNPVGRVLWSPDSRHLMVGPTFVPISMADAAGLAGIAVVDLDVTTGEFLAVPANAATSEFGYEPRRWSGRNIVELVEADREDGRRLSFQKTHGSWEAVERDTTAQAAQPVVRVEVRENINTPPAIYAVESATGRERLVGDLNPHLADFELGRVEVVHWEATDGRPWTGLLYHPSGCQPGGRCPFVVQTHGYLLNEFSLDGGFTTVFAAQPLAGRGIAVLQVGGPDDCDALEGGTPREADTYVAGFEGAIQHFIALGLADPDKVGIIGFSRTGWLVLSMLMRADVRLAAAEVADNIDGSYLQYVLADSGGRASYEASNGASPFGKGMEVWLRNAPGFNVEKFHTPLRMELDSGPISYVLSYWEVFTNLRHLGKPVELFVIPDIEHGTHVLQNPAQRLASQGATVDWFSFWLKGEEDGDPRKAEQYRRWRRLRLQQSNPKS